MELDFVLVSGTQTRNARVNLRVKNLSGTEHLPLLWLSLHFVSEHRNRKMGFRASTYVWWFDKLLCIFSATHFPFLYKVCNLLIK